MQHLPELWESENYAGLLCVGFGYAVVGAAGWMWSKDKFPFFRRLEESIVGNTVSVFKNIEQSIVGNATPTNKGPLPSKVKYRVASALSDISFEEEKEINIVDLNIQGDDISKCHQRFLLNGVRWVLKHRDAIETESLLEYVPRGESINSWTQMITSRYSCGELTKKFLCSSDDAVNIILNNMKLQLEKREDGSWMKVIHVQDKEFLVEFFEAATGSRPPVININRGVITKGGIHFFYYSTKNLKEFKGKFRETWVETMSSLVVRGAEKYEGGARAAMSQLQQWQQLQKELGIDEEEEFDGKQEMPTAN